MAEPYEAREPVTPPVTETQNPRLARRGGFLPGLIGGLLGGAAVVGGGGWYAYERGPIKPALEQLESTAAATRSPKVTVPVSERTPASTSCAMNAELRAQPGLTPPPAAWSWG